jgi:hypothetical protein
VAGSATGGRVVGSRRSRADPHETVCELATAVMLEVE